MFNFRKLKISLTYQSILIFEPERLKPGAPGLFTHELFLPWIHNLMLAYQEQNNPENDLFEPANTKYSKTYYTKKMN